MPPSLDEQYDQAKRKRRIAQGYTRRGPRPADPRPGHCSYCHRPILWGRTPERLWVPLDPEPSPLGRYALLPGQRAYLLPAGATTRPDVPRHHAHRTTCKGGLVE